MEIVIKIPDVEYKNMAKIANAGKEPLGYFERVIMWGTPLPEHHGRLIDADELKKNNEEYIIQYPTDREEDMQNKMVEWINEDITNAPTIIEGSDSE